MEHIRIEKLNTPRIVLDLPTKVQQSDLYEGVSEITGTAIPSYYEYKISGRMTMYNHLANGIMSQIHGSNCLLNDNDNDNDSQYTQLYRSITQTELTPNVCHALLELSLLWVSVQSGYEFKKKQITKFDWLSPDVLLKAYQNLNHVFPSEVHAYLEFEKPLIVPYLSSQIVGFADIYNKQARDLWELKTVTHVDTTHFLQVAIYCWMINKTSTSDRQVNRVNLYNILTNELFLLHVDQRGLDHIVEILYQNKIAKTTKQKDHDFIESCCQIMRKFPSS